MKKVLLCALAIIAAIFITCGNEPPEEFYNGTPEDDTAIGQVLDSNSALLYVDDLFNDSLIALSMQTCRWLMGDVYRKADSIIIKQLVDGLGDTCTVFARFQDLWYAKDTTCTVYLWDTFTVTLDYHWARQYIGYYDSLEMTPDTAIDTTVIPPETTIVWDTVGWRIGTVDTIKGVGSDTTGDYSAFTELKGEGLRHLFLEPARKDTVDENNDSISKMIEPRQWVLKRVSYGNYYFPNSGADIPYIYSTIFRSTLTSEWDTIYGLNYDTLFQGHAMNRFKAVDSLLEFTNGDTVYIDITLGGTTIVDSLCLFFASMNGIKLQLNSAGQGYLPITGSGITNLVLGVIHEDALYYIRPRSTYAVRYWLVPIRVR